MIETNRTILVWSLLVVAACGGGNEGSQATSVPPDPVSTTQTTPIATDTRPPTTVAGSTTSAQSVSPTASTTTSTIALTPTLSDGRPSTYMAVTADYEAVEVDTATGAIVRRFGQRADAASLTLQEEIAPNVIDGVWRSASGDVVLVSECCEPAAGRITFLGGDGALAADHSEPAWNGWWVVPSPNSDDVIITGYSTEVVEATTTGPRNAVALFENDGSGVGAIGWDLDGSSIYWYDETSGELVTMNRSGSGFAIASRAAIDWIGSDERLSGLGAQASGNVVSFVTRHGLNGEALETRGVVYAPETGEELAEFPVQTGSFFGGYDPSGRFLIYTTPTGAVTYQGLGRIEVLGEGYLHASW